jgi:hypothetical protein
MRRIDQAGLDISLSHGAPLYGRATVLRRDRKFGFHVPGLRAVDLQAIADSDLECLLSRAIFGQGGM